MSWSEGQQGHTKEARVSLRRLRDVEREKLLVLEKHKIQAFTFTHRYFQKFDMMILYLQKLVC